MTAGPDPHLHGFSVEGDLALYYRFAELVQLALTGSPPDEARGKAFDIALQFLAPLAVVEAPTHAAVLARICGARTSSVLAVACIALAERARHVVTRHQKLLEWLETPVGELPAQYRGSEPEDRASLERLRNALAGAGVEVPGLALGPDRWTAIFMTLHFAGLVQADQLETALVVASLAPTLAEAQAHRAGAFNQYPMNVPAFVYEEDH